MELTKIGYSLIKIGIKSLLSVNMANHISYMDDNQFKIVDSGVILEKYKFPKKVGIVFLGRRKPRVHSKSEKEKDELSLDFDQDACAFFFLQLNHHQNIFEFQIINLSTIKEKIPKKDESLFDWLDNLAQKHSDMTINYWIGITKEPIPKLEGWDFLDMDAEKTISRKILWLITSRHWDKSRMPPSLFEYLLATVFRCALESLDRDLNDDKLNKKFLRNDEHKQVTRGCIFDFKHRQTSVSIFKLCYGCKKRLSKLEELIKNKDKDNDIHLVSDVNTILSREWMGTYEMRDFPLFNLKRIYKYDVDRNSGYNKDWKEKFRDSITDKFAEWTLGNILGGIIGGLITALFFIAFGLSI